MPGSTSSARWVRSAAAPASPRCASCQRLRSRCGLLGRLLLQRAALVQPAVEGRSRAWHAENEAPLRLLLEDEPALAGVLAAAIGDDDTVAAAGGAVAPPPPAPTAATGENATVAAAELQKEAALDVLHVLARGPMSARIALGREPSLVPRLCALLIPPQRLPSRRAVDILASFAAAPGNRAAFRSHEVYIARLAMQQPDGNLPITAATHRPMSCCSSSVLDRCWNALTIIPTR